MVLHSGINNLIVVQMSNSDLCSYATLHITQSNVHLGPLSNQFI